MSKDVKTVVRRRQKGFKNERIWKEYKLETIYEREDKEWKGCIRGKYRTEKNKKGKDEGLKEYRIMRIGDGKHIGRREFRTERIQNEENIGLREYRTGRIQNGENIQDGKNQDKSIQNVDNVDGKTKKIRIYD